MYPYGVIVRHMDSDGDEISVKIYPDTIDFEGINTWLKKGLETLWKPNEPPEERGFVTEEIAELVIEIMKLQKVLWKEERGKASRDDVFEEAVDVLTTLLVFFVRDGYPIEKIPGMIENKIRRAVERYQLNGEK